MGEKMKNYSLVGKTVPRTDALDKVMGKSVYTDDLKMPGMLTGKRGRPSQARYIGTCPVCGREVRGTSKKLTVKHFDNEGQPCTGHKQPLKRPTLVE